MYAIAVKDHFMIAHSLQGEVFGPAQKLHGATYNVTAEFRTERLSQDGIVIDIGLALNALKAVLALLNYKNLDEEEPFRGVNTTTEYLAHYIHGQLAKRVRDSFQGTLKITLEESHVARGSYEGTVT
ncbi:6-pyruvoyl trahydropterin synthase family protein [Nitrosococcus wardiae]|uniref:6-carboxy-5,6,7,8-tetrahydropterin synthase n=1 Tax=Nitrosococcus wardiae TaxID=1814290 RepID=A0A4P7BZI3_9GAMM|nr:6-carboxytetrahydropterin synthase [Nitrosococcus wardiae]QBQ55638.1 6-carboxytetrahydropterin synthase [Nitrosococcus wardiae]